MNIRILASAVKDLARGYEFYEKHQRGLGSYFLDSLFSDIDALRLYGGIHPMKFGYHRALSKRFPFAIYYSYSLENGYCIR
jgi:hypothetical protein